MSKKSVKMVKQYKNSLFSISIKETGVLRFEAIKEMDYDKTEVQYILDNINYISAGKKYLVLVIANEGRNITYEGLKLLGQSQAFSYSIAKAYVIKTLYQRLMANFYVRIFKPKIPVKFFIKELDAEVWLLRKFLVT